MTNGGVQMIIRIVQMEFEEKLVRDFLKIFAANREKIRSFPGCTHLQLLQGEADPCVFFTYSHWDVEDDLNTYRNSDLFRGVWRSTRKLFRSAPKAWSLTDQTEVTIHTL
jgi:heme-degrading monooxygenase HmoA